MYVALQKWSKEVRKALVEKETNLQKVSEKIGHSYTTVTALLSGRVVKGNYLEVAKMINSVLGIEVLPEKPTLPSAEWVGAVRYKMFMTKMTVNQLSKTAGFNRDRVSLVLNGHTMDRPVIDKINECLEIDVPVVLEDAN